MINQIIAVIAKELALRTDQVAGAVELLDAGNTIPFIARYRKEATGGLDEVQLRQIEARLAYLRNLHERKQAVLASIDEQGKLTDGAARRPSKPPRRCNRSRTSTCPTGPSAARAPPSPASAAWSRWLS